VAERTECTSLS